MSRRRGNGSGKLKDAHKAFMVQRLAVFDSPKQAAEALMAEYRVEISPQGAEAYNPQKRAGRRLSERWRELFKTIRERFLDQLYEVPESHKAVRTQIAKLIPAPGGSACERSRDTRSSAGGRRSHCAEGEPEAIAWRSLHRIAGIETDGR